MHSYALLLYLFGAGPARPRIIDDSESGGAQGGPGRARLLPLFYIHNYAMKVTSFLIVTLYHSRQFLPGL